MSIGNVAHPWLPSDERRSGGRFGEWRSEGDMASLCRTLFGSTDHELNGQFLMQELREIRSEQRRRWNFDFETETPLPGRYQWVRVKQDEDKGQEWDDPIPPEGDLPFSRIDSVGENSSSPSKGLCNGEHKIAAGAQRCNCGQTLPTGEIATSPKGGGAAGFFKQTRVTEYLRKRKCKATSRPGNKTQVQETDDSTSYRHITTRSLSQISSLQTSGESRNSNEYFPQ